MPSLYPLLGLLLFWGVFPLHGENIINRGLPDWIEFRAETRGRFERYTGLNYAEDSMDSYLLHRLRLDTTFRPTPWMRVFGQIQDSRAAGRRSPVPAKVRDTFDLREAFAEFGDQKQGWLLRAGRQEMMFGDHRLIGNGPWANTPRAFDAARLTYHGDDMQFDWIAGTRALPRVGSFDDAVTSDDRLAGFYSSFRSLIPEATLEPYFLWKGTSGATSEAGLMGEKDVYAGGARLTGPLPARFDYTVEAVAEAGAEAGDSLRAWATALTLGQTVMAGPRTVRLLAEYDYASGDSDPSDGRRGTFDQFFPTNHGKYGIADSVGWRNMHGARAGVAIRMTEHWRVAIDYWSLWLAERNDYLYRFNGTPVVRNPDATSSHIQQEIDVQNVIRLTPSIEFILGFAQAFPGRFLRESTPGHQTTFFYCGWQLGI